MSSSESFNGDNSFSTRIPTPNRKEFLRSSFDSRSKKFGIGEGGFRNGGDDPVSLMSSLKSIQQVLKETSQALEDDIENEPNYSNRSSNYYKLNHAALNNNDYEEEYISSLEQSENNPILMGDSQVLFIGNDENPEKYQLNENRSSVNSRMSIKSPASKLSSRSDYYLPNQGELGKYPEIGRNSPSRRIVSRSEMRSSPISNSVMEAESKLNNALSAVKEKLRLRSSIGSARSSPEIKNASSSSRINFSSPVSSKSSFFPPLDLASSTTSIDVACQTDLESISLKDQKEAIEEAYKVLKNDNINLSEQVSELSAENSTLKNQLQIAIQAQEESNRLIEHFKSMQDKEKSIAVGLEENIKRMVNNQNEIRTDDRKEYTMLKDKFDQLYRENYSLQLKIEQLEGSKAREGKTSVQTSPFIDMPNVPVVVEEKVVPAEPVADARSVIKSLEEELSRLAAKKQELESEYRKIPASFAPASPRYRSRHEISRHKIAIEKELDEIDSRTQKIRLDLKRSITGGGR